MLPATCHVSPSSLLYVCRSFGEIYLPWLNDLARHRLEAEFTTLRSYLQLLKGGMASETVRGLMLAYVRAVISKAASAR